MSVCSLPEVGTPIIPKQRVISSSVDLSNDYGTPNLAFIYHVLSPAGNLASLREDLDSWNAWELAIAEEHVVTQLNAGNLPEDDSIPSRMKRSAYRGKVIATLREQDESAWLITNSSPLQKYFEGDIGKDQINAKIRELVRKFYLTSRDSSSDLVINIIANVIASSRDAFPRHVLSDVHIPQGGALQDAYPGTRQCNFTVTQQELEASDDVHLAVEWMESRFKLDTRAWKEYSGNQETEERIKAGQEILRQMRLIIASEVVPKAKI